MIEIDQSLMVEPDEFDATCRKKGAQWIVDHPKASRKPGKTRPKDLWTPFKPKLADAFHDLCAYGAMYEPFGTVDHFLPIDADETLAYEWGNYRFASGWINSSKNKALTILDPLEVREGWFEILLPSLQLVVVPERVPEPLRELAVYTLTRLHLRDDERILRQRRKWYHLYQVGKLTLEGLHDVAPMIASAVEKQLVANAALANM